MFGGRTRGVRHDRPGNRRGSHRVVARGRFGVRGASMTTSVPLPGMLVTLKVPPTRASRSALPTRPRPRPSLVGRTSSTMKPTPLSRIVTRIRSSGYCTLTRVIFARSDDRRVGKEGRRRQSGVLVKLVQEYYVV